MSTVLTWEANSGSLEETLALASQIGQNLKGGEVIELISDLGGGKTVFVKGVAKGMGIKDLIGSPTFTISSQYKAGDLILHHFDFYRLGEPGIIANELDEIIGLPENVVAIEWADLVNAVLPQNRLRIQIHTLGENQRKLKFHYTDDLEYLIPANT